MGVFIRTLIICLILCSGYYIWVFLGKESYDKNLETNTTTVSKPQEVISPKEIVTPAAQEKLVPKTEQRLVKIYFMADENTVRSVNRNITNPTLEDAISELLKGPTKYEKERGVYSEIPDGVRLLWVKGDNGKIIINLTRNFQDGGGTIGIQNRIKQIKTTVDAFESKKPVYLYLDGKQVDYMGGEGVYIKQPLN